jgi:hypothetical protein
LTTKKSAQPQVVPIGIREIKPRMNANEHELILKEDFDGMVGCATEVLSVLGHARKLLFASIRVHSRPSDSLNAR